MAALAAIGAAPAGAAQGADATPAAGAVELTLVRQSLVVDSNGVFSFEVDTSGAPPESRLSVELHGAVSSYDAYLGSVGADPPTDRLPENNPPISQPLSAYPVTVDGSVAISFVYNLNRPGVYPVVIRLQTPDGTTRRVVTAVARRPELRRAPPPLRVALVVPFASALARRADGSVRIPDAEVVRLDGIVRTLGAHPELPVTIAPTPETLVALEQVGPTGESVLRSLNDLARGRQVLARPYVHIDPAALARSGGSDIVGTQLVEGDIAVRRLLPSADASPRYWLADRPLDPLSLTVLRDNRVSTFLVPRAQLDPAAPVPAHRPAGLATGADPAELVVTEVGVVEKLAADSPQVAAAQLAAALAQRYFDTWDAEAGTARESSPKGTVLVLPERWLADADFVSVLASLLAPPNPLLRPVTVERLVGDVDKALDERGRTVTGRLAPTTPADYGDYVRALEATAKRLFSVAGMLPDSDRLRTGAMPLLLAASDASLTGGQRTAYLATVDAQLDRLLGSVSVGPAGRVTLTSRAGEFPLTLRNGLGGSQEVHVLVLLRSPSLVFPAGRERFEQVLAPGSTQVPIAVRAPTSGRYPLDVEIRTPDGGQLIATDQVIVQSTAVPGLGVGLSVGAVAFLALWWVRHLRQQGRQRRAARPGHPTARPETEA